MKHTIDIDALKGCLDLLQTPFIYGDKRCVYLDDVKELIDKFPKD